MHSRIWLLVAEFAPHAGFPDRSRIPADSAVGHAAQRRGSSPTTLSSWRSNALARASPRSSTATRLTHPSRPTGRPSSTWRCNSRSARATCGSRSGSCAAVPGCTAWRARRRGCALLRGLLERHWATVHPQLDAADNDDPTMRLSAVRTPAGDRCGAGRPAIGHRLAPVRGGLTRARSRARTRSRRTRTGRDRADRSLASCRRLTAC